MKEGIHLEKENTNNYDRLAKDLSSLKKTKMEIGIFSKSGGHILMIATVNEYGMDIQITDAMRKFFMAMYLDGYMNTPLSKNTKAIHIPERAFIRGTAKRKQKNITKIVEVQMNNLIRGKINLNQFYYAVGESLAGLTRDYLTDLKKPKNHPMTLAMKSPKSNPLINSGRLRESITWRVV